MFTDPVIVHNASDGRSYIKTYINGQRYRFYNGKEIGIHCFPNKGKSSTEKLRLLITLQYEVKKKLEKGWRPYHVRQENPYKDFTLLQCVTLILTEIEKEDISDYYRRDMNSIGEELQDFLRDKKLQRLSVNAVTSVTIDTFLERYKTSGTYFMTKRSSLAGLFRRMVKKGMFTENPVHKTEVKKSVPQLNMIFSKEQLRGILQHLEAHNPNLYLCALLMYGAFLRPHKEIRLLQRRHLSSDLSTITLSGSENKSKRIRIVRLPNYVVQELLRRGVKELPADHYIISKSPGPFNSDYFKKLWSRVKKQLAEKFTLTENHTLYSFRHSAAIEVYNKTKDPYRVQRAMFHASLTTTLVYLRSLGLLVDTSEHDSPEL